MLQLLRWEVCTNGWVRDLCELLVGFVSARRGLVKLYQLCGWDQRSGIGGDCLHRMPERLLPACCRGQCLSCLPKRRFSELLIVDRMCHVPSGDLLDRRFAFVFPLSGWLLPGDLGELPLFNVPLGLLSAPCRLEPLHYLLSRLLCGTGLSRLRHLRCWKVHVIGRFQLLLLPAWELLVAGSGGLRDLRRGKLPTKHRVNELRGLWSGHPAAERRRVELRKLRRGYVFLRRWVRYLLRGILPAERGGAGLSCL